MTDPVKKVILSFSELGNKEDELGVKAIDRYNTLLAINARQGELIRDIADWYEGPKEYMGASLWKRLTEEVSNDR